MAVPAPETVRPGAANARDAARIALIGNPNTGKTTLFNRLCGARAKTSNFPGTTTASRVGRAALPGEWMAEDHRSAGPVRTRPECARDPHRATC